MKGAELQEVTSCHDEENGYIQEVLKDVFRPDEASPPTVGLVNPRPLFSLTPVKTVEFSLYDDVKYSLAGMVEDKMFNGLVKQWFMRIFTLKLNELYKQGTIEGKRFKIFPG